MIYNTRNKGTRKPVKSPILTILNHLCGIEHVKKILRNVPLSVPLSVPLFCKKRIFEHKKGDIQARHSPECRPKMETLYKYHSNINKTAIYHHVSSAIG